MYARLALMQAAFKAAQKHRQKSPVRFGQAALLCSSLPISANKVHTPKLAT